MNTITISQEHYSDLQMTIAKLLKQVDDLKKQLANTLEIGSRLASNLQQERDKNEMFISMCHEVTRLDRENRELRNKLGIATIQYDNVCEKLERLKAAIEVK